MDQEALILSLRTSLAQAQQINNAFMKKYPKEYSKILESLPPPPLPSSRDPRDGGPESALDDDPSGSVAPNGGEESGAPDGSAQGAPSDEQSYSSSDFTSAPLVTEEQAGAMFMETRNMERDAFFKARIAHGIDDDKVFDLSKKVDAKLEVEKAQQEGGASGLLGCMKMFPDEEGVAKRALKALLPLCKDEVVRRDLGHLGIVEVISSTIKTYPKNEGIVHFAIRVLGNLAFGNDDNRARIGQLVLIDVLRAMQAYPQNVEMQQHAMITLTNCAHENDANKRLIANRGGFNVILDAMEAHLGAEKLQRQACWATLTVAGEESSARRAASDGAVGAILAAMVNFGENSDIQLFGLWALINISLGSDALAKFVADNGAPEIAQKAVMMFPGGEEIGSKAEELLKIIGKYVNREG